MQQRGNPLTLTKRRRCQWPSIRSFAGVFLFCGKGIWLQPSPLAKQKTMEKIRFGWGNHDKIGQNLKQLRLFWPFLHHFLCAKSMISSPEAMHGWSCQHFKARNVEGGQTQTFGWSCFSPDSKCLDTLLGGFLLNQTWGSFCAMKKNCEMTGGIF